MKLSVYKVRDPRTTITDDELLDLRNHIIEGKDLAGEPVYHYDGWGVKSVCARVIQELAKERGIE